VNNAAFTVLYEQYAAGTPLTSTQPTCLQNQGQAVRGYSGGLTNTVITNDLVGFFDTLIQDGNLCDPGWDQSTDPDTVASTYTVPTSGVQAASACCYAQSTQYPYYPATGTGGPYNLWWNINGHTSSAWLFTQWFGYGAHSFQGPNSSPQCSPGSTAPGYSVTINFCYSINNGALYYSTDRINFTVTFSISVFGIGYTVSDVHQYYVNEWINGFYQEGCSIGC
jgi:hypothetical protein